MKMWKAPFLFVAASAGTSNTTVTIAPGVDMPFVNFGVCNQSQAISLGIRGLDTAYSYGDDNQRNTGKAVRESGVSRSELFVVSKIPCCPATEFWGVGVRGCENHRWPPDDLQHDMDVLGLDYVDVMLMHWPCDNVADTIGTYKMMEDFMKAGKTRALGVSNFNADLLGGLLSQATIKPAVNQVGFSIGFHATDAAHGPRPKGIWGSDDETYEYAKRNGITTVAFAPLGHATDVDVMHDPTVQAVASAHGKTTAQVGFRWLVQQGIPLVTSSNTPSHVQSDLDIFDFELTADEMDRLSAVKLQPRSSINV